MRERFLELFKQLSNVIAILTSGIPEKNRRFRRFLQKLAELQTRFW